jgi:hypothetical protein
MLCQLESGLCQIVPHQTSAEHRRIGRTAGQQLRIQRDKLPIVGVQHPGQQQQQGPGQELRIKRQPRTDFGQYERDRAQPRGKSSSAGPVTARNLNPKVTVTATVELESHLWTTEPARHSTSLLPLCQICRT